MLTQVIELERQPLPSPARRLPPPQVALRPPVRPQAASASVARKALQDELLLTGACSILVSFAVVSGVEEDSERQQDAVC
jgi:hypothetical protein